MSNITDDTLIDSIKYKTIGELKKAPITSIIQVSSRMKKSPQRDYLDAYLFDTHYSKIKLTGSLTHRIQSLNNNVCYREIMKRCFNDVDIFTRVSTIDNKVPAKTCEYILSLHTINPSAAGTFIDYLIRRIISELTCKSFYDSRSESGSYSLSRYTSKDGVIIKDCFSKDGKTHCCETDTCKYKTIFATYTLPKCQCACYERTKDTTKYKTQDITDDIFITSLFHSEWFGQSMVEEQFVKFYQLLISTETIDEVLVNPLMELCKGLIQDKVNIRLNPNLGNICILADADMILDDTLIDFKCTKCSSKNIELLQLLGYSSLAMCRDSYKINTITILNILGGYTTTYDISFINLENCTAFIKILSNQ